MKSKQTAGEISEHSRMLFFVDESGDPNFLGKGKKDLISSGSASLWFMVGYLELNEQKTLSNRFAEIRKEIAQDEYINQIPSVRHSLRCFHANKDCREVQERVFKALKAVDYCLRAIHRVYNFQDFRYYRFLQEKISLVHDLSYGKKYYDTYFNRTNPVPMERFSGNA